MWSFPRLPNPFMVATRLIFRQTKQLAYAKESILTSMLGNPPYIYMCVVSCRVCSDMLCSMLEYVWKPIAI